MKATLSYSQADQNLARFAAAMGHPARIAIVRLLLHEGEHTCGQITEQIPLAQATVSQHLKALRDANILSVRECGPCRCYKLEPTQIGNFCDAMQITLGRKTSPDKPAIL
jgi:ArsR family transcriptional regulator